MENEEKFINAFNAFDTDNSGEIDSSELQDLMTKLGYKPHPDDIDEIIELAD